MSEKESIAVSVIIPVHNAAGYISDTLSTVLSQTLNDIEIIIVNDCSDDNTLEIVSALAETDSRIRVINNTTNLGGGGSRNIGLDAATGEYVIFLDDDDYADNMMLERMYARASDIQADVVICRSQSFDPALQVYAPMPWSVRQELLPDLKFFHPRIFPLTFSAPLSGGHGTSFSGVNLLLVISFAFRKSGRPTIFSSSAHLCSWRTEFRS
jgi:glycosyltransferase involved in cell wall biosynthesis